MSMRILFMADMDPDPNLGASGTEVQTLDALRRLGCEVDAVWADDMPRRIAHGNLHYLIELPRSFRTALRRKLSKDRFDFVRVNQPHGFLAAEWLQANAPQSVFVHRSHGLELRANEVLRNLRRSHGAEEKRVMRRGASFVMERLLALHTLRTVGAADGHEVCASEDRDFLVNRLGVAPEMVGVIPAAAPAELLQTEAPAMSRARLQSILYVSQYAFFKAPMVVAAAFNALAEKHDELKFTWVCDRRHHPAVASIASNRVELLDWMPQPELTRVFDSHGIFVFPSFYEGFGKVFLEAMSRGAIPVATDIAGARDVITHGVNGLLVPPNDPGAVVQAVEHLLGNPDLSFRLSAAAADCARQYTWEQSARKTLEFYEQLLRRKRRIADTI